MLYDTAPSEKLPSAVTVKVVLCRTVLRSSTVRSIVPLKFTALAEAFHTASLGASPPSRLILHLVTNAVIGRYPFHTVNFTVAVYPGPKKPSMLLSCSIRAGASISNSIVRRRSAANAAYISSGVPSNPALWILL